MKVVFKINIGETYSYIAILQPIARDENYHKLELRYFSITDDFKLREIKDCCKETLSLEKQARKYINNHKDKNYVLWSY